MHRSPVLGLLLLVVVAAAVAWFLFRTPSGGDGGRAPDSAQEPLLRPLAQRHDARLRGRLHVPAQFGVMQGAGPNEARFLTALRQAGVEALQHDAADVGAMLDLGGRLLWLGYWPAAEEFATQVLAVVPEDAPGKALLSAVRREQGRRTEALALADQALASNPELSHAILSRADDRAARGQLDAAVADLRSVLDRDPSDPSAAFLLGTLWTDAGRFAAAAPWLLRAREFVPDPEVGKGPFITTVSAFADLLAGREPYRTNHAAADVVMRQLPLPAVQATLSAKGRTVQGWFVLDCGASLTVLGPSAAGFACEAGTSTEMFTVAGKTSNAAGLLERITIGDLVVDDVPVLVDHGETAPHAEGVIGTIGVGLMRNFRVVLDVPAARCRFDPPGLAVEPHAAAEVPFQLVHNMILVPGRFRDGIERTFLFDSGATNLFVSPKVLGAEFGALPGRTRKAVAFGGAEADTVEVPLSRPFVFGGRELPQRTAIGDPSIDLRNAYMHLECAGTIGLVIKARYVLDFARQRLLLYER